MSNSSIKIKHTKLDVICCAGTVHVRGPWVQEVAMGDPGTACARATSVPSSLDVCTF